MSVDKLNYEAFCERLLDRLSFMLGTEASVTTRKFRKNNGVLMEGIFVCCPGEHIMPTVYLDGLYRQYEGGSSFEQILSELLECYGRDFGQLEDTVSFLRILVRYASILYSN